MTESWHAARLIPTSGINGAQEQERRATSALLAVMTAVREFGRALTQPLGAPAGPVQTFIEVPFDLGDRHLIPDGLIQVVRGQRHWTALVEVKTGQKALDAIQLQSYLEIAQAQGFNAVISISNQIPSVPGQHPTTVDRKYTKKVSLHHMSWSRILTEAVVQKEHRGVADRDQAWILGELIRYLEHPRSGALEFSDMGQSWVAVRDAVIAGTLRPTDRGLTEVIGRFDGLIQYLCLRLGRQLGTDVTPSLSRKQIADPMSRAQILSDELTGQGRLSAGIRIPGAVGVVNVVADLRAGQITCQMDVDAPQSPRPTTRVNWLVRQLHDAPGTLRMEARTAYSRGNGSAELLQTVRSNPTVLITDPQRELRTFKVAQVLPAGTKRGDGKGSFIASVVTAVDRFYEDVVQVIKPWVALAPPMRTSPASTDTAESLTSTALSSQDGPADGRPPGLVSVAEPSPQVDTIGD